MGHNRCASGIWIPQKTLQELEHMPRDQILHPKDEISYLLGMVLSMAEYFQRQALAASIRLSIEVNESDAY